MAENRITSLSPGILEENKSIGCKKADLAKLQKDKKVGFMCTKQVLNNVSCF